VAALQVKRLKRRVELARSFGKPSIIIESNSFEMPHNFVRTSDAIMFQVQVGTALGVAPSAHRDPAEMAAPATPGQALSQGIARGARQRERRIRRCAAREHGNIGARTINMTDPARRLTF
jgi:hypothetical protein